MIVVVDASVAAKWYLPEPDSDKAAQFLSAEYECIAPDLIRLEIGSLLLRHVRRRHVAPEEWLSILTERLPAALNVVSSIEYTRAAFDIARAAGGSFYDAIYLAVARVAEAPIITDDAAMMRTARSVNITAHALADGPPRAG